MNYVALLTAPGRAAVATVRVQGPEARAIVARFFHSASGKRIDHGSPAALADRPWFGRWNGPAGEELVVTLLDPRTVEIHCHGGSAASAAIVADLVEAGCSEINWEDILLASEPDPIRRAAEVALAHASTERAAATLLDQYNGALRRALEQALVAIQSGDQSHARQIVDDLLGRAALGQHLVQPFRVVLVGEPNVGKSSLMNALVGYQRAIVHETPGTTRDALTATTAIDGWPVELVDTAGIRQAGDLIEQAGIARARQQANSADLVLRVIDRSAPRDSKAAQLLAEYPWHLVVYSKCDLPPAPVPAFAAERSTGPLAEAAELLTSARTGAGIAELVEEIGRRLAPQPPVAGAAVPFTTAQIEALTTACRFLENHQTIAAQRYLAELL